MRLSEFYECLQMLPKNAVSYTFKILKFIKCIIQVIDCFGGKILRASKDGHLYKCSREAKFDGPINIIVELYKQSCATKFKKTALDNECESLFKSDRNQAIYNLTKCHWNQIEKCIN